VELEQALREVSFTLVRFSVFAAGALLFGLVPVALLVLRPAFAGLDGERWDEARTRVSARIEGFVQAALVATAVATALGLLLQAILVSEFQPGDIGSSSFSSVFESTFGRWYLVRLPLLAGLAVLLVGRVRRSLLAGAGDLGRAPAPLWWALWGAMAFVLLVTSTLSGHAAVARPRPVALVNDVVHMVAGATWFAGIIVLGAALPEAWRRGSGESALHLLAPAVLRFSQMAMISIGVVAATGIVNGFLHVGAAGDLYGSGYGRALVLKVLLFVGIVALGGINHFVLRDRMRRGPPADAERARRQFRRTIAAELAIGIALFGMTGVLVGQSRTRQAALGRGQFGGGAASASVLPAAPTLH
jgi:copper transport protein